MVLLLTPFVDRACEHPHPKYSWIDNFLRFTCAIFFVVTYKLSGNYRDIIKYRDIKEHDNRDHVFPISANPNDIKGRCLNIMSHVGIMGQKSLSDPV